ncbi:hypothetical protein PAXRUDRAFT_32790 [Paxillus rubicundulus Ve08.2h10]|uniref:Uncharacterized protein n=1 Tax=Paxillus rubicundulus Ve08.2h10 TaxID=930991 RepID=A0A0D0DRM0_9AGAM|nr:hypothetical protein PAXRUDRAFT_32790 [Paxillus rubicundulus Ve08.2h10]
MCIHQDFVETAVQLKAASTGAARERIVKSTGIKDLPTMCLVGSLDYTCSIPWECFHLLLKNIIHNLVDLWTGQLNIIPHIWDDIGNETAAAVAHIPAPFVHMLSNITSDCLLFTPESQCFWFIYLAPKLLENQFSKGKYYKHICNLVKIMKTTLQCHITAEQVSKVEEGLTDWVEKYEKYYYLYCIEHLSTCMLTVHGLLHLCIRYCDPVWTMWTFYMGNFCTTLQNNL